MSEKTSYKPELSWSDRQRQQQTGEETAVFYTIEKQQGTIPEMLNFRFKNGNENALPTISIEEVFYNPSQGITLFCRMATVQIQGRNLRRLYALLTTRKVTEIREFAEDGLLFNDDALLITRIEYSSTYMDSFHTV